MADKKSSKKKNKKGSNNNKKKQMMTNEQTLAYKCASEWVYLEKGTDENNDGFGVLLKKNEKLVFELHCHSICSDGYLSPSKVVERAHLNGVILLINIIDMVMIMDMLSSYGYVSPPKAVETAQRNWVKVLALTDHDTMAGIPEALDAACKFGMKIIPGVEISTIYSPRGENGLEEPVHVLAYYSSCGPMRPEELEKFLANIRDGRYLRAKNMISKLNKLKLPVKWEHVAKIAGTGVAPGRLHVARAMVEAGHVENLKQAFARYLYDGGPAYSTGSEPLAEEAVKLICDTGGVAVLAHPWALKNPTAIVRRLKDAGLHGIEVYKSDGKLAAYSDMADTYDLMKLGGSDFHGRGGQQESNLGSVNLPVLAVHDFLKIARPIWCNAIRSVLENYADEPSQLKLEQIMKFAKSRQVKGGSVTKNINDLIDLCLATWLTVEERKASAFEAVRLKLSRVPIGMESIQSPTAHC